MISTHRSVFFTGFAMIPAVFWFGTITGSLEMRKDAEARLLNADQVVAQNQMKVRHSKTLQQEWNEFKPLANTELENLDDDLNPILLQKRIVSVGRIIGFDIDNIKQLSDVNSQSPEWTIQASSTWENLVLFIDHLERGEYRVRFSSIALSMPSGQYVDGGVQLKASFSIPKLPNSSELGESQ